MTKTLQLMKWRLNETNIINKVKKTHSKYSVALVNIQNSEAKN